MVIGTESKLDSDHVNCETFPVGYNTNVIRRDRNSNGGGVFIIAKDEISMSEITVTNKECQLVLASITRVTLGAFYRQPNNTVTEINELLTNITSCTTYGQSELIIGGDFNLPGILWSDGAVIKDVPSYGVEVDNRFIEVCDILGVTQIVTEPTRESNILDLLHLLTDTVMLKLFLASATTTPSA